MALLAVLWFLTGLVVAVNYYCEASSLLGATIWRYEGKFNVPIKPDHEPNAVLFLWPGLNPYAGQGGMMQPVLTYGANYGQGNYVWGMSNWFTNCPSYISSSGYCHDQYQAVEEGDVISFSMQYYKTFSNGTQLWMMSWESQNQGHGSNFMVYWEADNVESVWSTEAEFYLDPAVSTNHNKMPRSNFYTWDLVATASDGRKFSLSYGAHGSNPGAIQVECDITVTSYSTTYSHAQVLTMPNAVCPAGYSREYNYGCQSFCGCNNADGTPKIQCDYCCTSANGYCQNANGPSYSFKEDFTPHVVNATQAFPPGVDKDGNPLPAPGQLAQAEFAPKKTTLRGTKFGREY